MTQIQSSTKSTNLYKLLNASRPLFLILLILLVTFSGYTQSSKQLKKIEQKIQTIVPKGWELTHLTKGFCISSADSVLFSPTLNPILHTNNQDQYLMPYGIYILFEPPMTSKAIEALKYNNDTLFTELDYILKQRGTLATPQDLLVNCPDSLNYLVTKIRVCPILLRSSYSLIITDNRKYEHHHIVDEIKWTESKMIFGKILKEVFKAHHAPENILGKSAWHYYMEEYGYDWVIKYMIPIPFWGKLLNLPSIPK